MAYKSILTLSSSKKGYIIFLYITGMGTILMFSMAMIAQQTIEVGIGRFRMFGLNNDNTEIVLYTPLAAFCLVPLSFLTLINGMRCYRDRDKRRKSVWYWYLYMKGFLILGLFGVGIYALIEGNGSSSNHINRLIKKSMDHYDHSFQPEVKYHWDKFQKLHDCCGTNSYSDWQDVAFGAFLLATPTSCCLRGKRKNRDCGMNMLPEYEFASSHINTRGCFPFLFGPTRTSIVLLGVLMILLGIIHVITLMSSFLLANVSGVSDISSHESKELHNLQKMYEPDTSTRNKIYRRHLYMDHGYR